MQLPLYICVKILNRNLKILNLDLIILLILPKTILSARQTFCPDSIWTKCQCRPKCSENEMQRRHNLCRKRDSNVAQSAIYRPIWQHCTVVNDRNQYFGRYRNFGYFGIGRNSTDTDTKRCFIPIPKLIPKDQTFSVLKVFNLALNLNFN